MLTSQCLTYEPAQRPSFRTILRDLTRLQPQSEPYPCARSLGQAEGPRFLLMQAQCTQGVYSGSRCVPDSNSLRGGMPQVLNVLPGDSHTYLDNFLLFSLGENFVRLTQSQNFPGIDLMQPTLHFGPVLQKKFLYFWVDTRGSHHLLPVWVC